MRSATSQAVSRESGDANRLDLGKLKFQAQGAVRIYRGHGKDSDDDERMTMARFSSAVSSTPVVFAVSPLSAANESCDA